MKEIRVTYLANIRDVTGKDKEIISLYTGTVQELIDTLNEKYSLFERGLHARVMINGKVIWKDFESEEIQEGDSVVIVPPIGGGDAVVSDVCNKCGVCVQECPKKAISLGEDRAYVNPSICVDCNTCVKVCPKNAISIHPSEGVICSYCPVNCQIKEGDLGACLRYKNLNGSLVLARKIAVPSEKTPDLPLVTGVGAGNTQPCFVPAPVIVEDTVEDVDVVTVVSATPLSFSLLKLKIDTDEFIGEEGEAVYRNGKKVGMIVTEEYGSKMIDIGGVNVFQGKNGITAARTVVEIANGEEVELRVGRKRVKVSVKIGKPPVINGEVIKRMRLGCGSAVIAMFAPLLKEVADEVIVLDSHITGLLSEHSAGKFLGMKYSGVVPFGIKSTDGRYFGEHGDGIGGTPVKDPRDAIRSIDFDQAWDGMRILVTDTTGDHISVFILEKKNLKEIEPDKKALDVVKTISKNCEKAKVSALYCGGVGGSARAGIANNPLAVTEAVHKGEIKVTVGGAKAFILPGGGINFYVDVEKVMGERPFTYIPTPATVAPMEYTMPKDVFIRIGGHLKNVTPLSKFLREHEIERL
jgi:MoaD family protein